MLPKDGWYEVYAVQVKDSNGWNILDTKVVGEPPGFSKEDKCYIITGIIGTFKRGLGYHAIEWLRSKNRDKDFRLVLLLVSQETKILDE